MRRWLEWFVRDPDTGRIVIAQPPNLSLSIFLVAAAVRLLLRPEGTVGTVVNVVATASLLWWAADEILRGASPFRRVLGAVVLVATVAGRLL